MTQEHDHEQHDNEHGQELLTRNKKLLAYLVHDFMQRGGKGCQSGVIDRDDLLQEVALSFLEEVKRYGEEEARKHKRTYFHSMYMAAIKAYPLSMPKRSQGFKELKKNLALHFEPWEEVSEYRLREEYCIPERMVSEREVLLTIEREGGLNQEERYIIELKAQGMNQKEIARILHTSNATVTRRVKEIKRKLKEKRVLQ